MSAPTKPKIKGKHRRIFEVYRTPPGDDGHAPSQPWRWRCWAKNGQIIATGGEAFAGHDHAARMARSFMDTDLFAPDVLVVDGVLVL